jgi:Nif11 domain
MSKEYAKEFFDKLENDPALRAKIKLGLETLAKIAADYNVTEEELSAELRKRWEGGGYIFYSEPPGF